MNNETHKKSTIKAITMKFIRCTAL